MYAIQTIGRPCSILREKEHIAKGNTAAWKGDPTRERRYQVWRKRLLAFWHQEPLYRDLPGAQSCL